MPKQSASENNPDGVFTVFIVATLCHSAMQVLLLNNLTIICADAMVMVLLNQCLVCNHHCGIGCTAVCYCTAGDPAQAGYINVDSPTAHVLLGQQQMEVVADINAPGCHFQQNVLMEASGPKPHKLFQTKNYFSVLGEKSAYFSYL